MAHTGVRIEAEITISGINAEVFPAPWELRLGYRGIKGESADPLTVEVAGFGFANRTN
jgi:hypothetical protein